MSEMTYDASNPDAGSIRALLEAHESALNALPFANLRAPRVTRMRAIQQASDLLGAFAVIDSQLHHIYSPEYIEKLRETVGALPVYRDLFVAADLALELPWSPETKVQREELTTKVRDHDTTLSRWVGAAIEEAGTADERTVAKLTRPGTGRQDDAEDTIRWVDAGLARDEIRELIPVKVVASMPAMREDARTLLLLLGIVPDGTDGPNVVRRRAYTLFANAFDCVLANGAHAARQLGIDVTFEPLWPGPATAATKAVATEPPAIAPIADPIVN